MVLKKFKYKKVSSTNDIAMQKIRQGYTSGVIISDNQTQGRGRHGKKWVSNKGNLFFSVFFILFVTLVLLAICATPLASTTSLPISLNA